MLRCGSPLFSSCTSSADTSHPTNICFSSSSLSSSSSSPPPSSSSSSSYRYIAASLIESYRDVFSKAQEAKVLDKVLPTILALYTEDVTRMVEAEVSGKHVGVGTGPCGGCVVLHSSTEMWPGMAGAVVSALSGG